MSDIPRVRVGVVGTKRGASLARRGVAAGLEIASLCGLDHGEVDALSAEFGVRGHFVYEDFLDTDMDGVILANAFDEHTPLAIAALDRGFHVLSESTTSASLAECVALVDATERSERTFMPAASFAYAAFVREMRRRYGSGDLGELVYGEAESVEGFEPASLATSDRSHWHGRITWPQYAENPLTALVAVTGMTPTAVGATAIPRPRPTAGEAGTVLMLRFANGAIARVLSAIMPGDQTLWIRLHCTDGLIENQRGADPAVVAGSHFGSGDLLAERVRVRREPWQVGANPIETMYSVDHAFRATPGRFASYEGAVGGDGWMLEDFARACTGRSPPLFDVYQAAAFSAVGIQATRSSLSGSAMLPVPDFRDPAQRAIVVDDHWRPSGEAAGPSV